ncbi:HTH-type transcriptional regulator CdhR [BD1-7 clade bacterium]|uniref:HTH-type transcriptional regulator CdhR n=1 Tax=BD1-7 clade bacterium TaxID=2029982 RepID=A0A5S9QFZ6_9GAMM|nr:HTH-type transcriptional regulator CdhR [BD1-7 clade bacterium]CAA0116911.1 HTH-type transcriptional regulator CdhR [BD1-7 clade bacterium]
MQSVTFVMFDHCMSSSISLPLEMLNAADNISRAGSRRRRGLNINLAAPTLDPVISSGGLPIVPTCRLSDIKESELIIIPALWRSPTHTVAKHPDIVDWLKMAAPASEHLCAVGTGSTFLAEAGLLADKAATTHWYYFDEMERRYPAVKWKRDHLITQSDNIYCAGSVNSVADLTIHFIETGYSAAVAKRVESQFSPEIRRAYDNYLFDDGNNLSVTDELMASAKDYIRQNYTKPIDFDHLATSMGIGIRSFQRRFKQAFSLSALQYQQSVRIQNAKDLLKDSNLNIQDIAVLLGYADASHFAQVFKKHAAQTPKAFRNAVRGKLFRA